MDLVEIFRVDSRQRKLEIYIHILDRCGWLGLSGYAQNLIKSSKDLDNFVGFLANRGCFILALVMCCFRIILKYMFFRSNIYTYIKHYTCKYPCLDVIQKIEYHNVARISLLQK